jgi:hypothetical protein
MSLVKLITDTPVAAIEKTEDLLYITDSGTALNA